MRTHYVLAALLLVASPSFAQAATPSCQITFRLGANTEIEAAFVEVVYEGAPGEFPGDGVNVDCEKVNDVGGTQSDDDSASSLRLTVAGPVDAPVDFARCIWNPTSRSPTTSDFDLSEQDAFDGDFQPIDPQITISDIDCDGTVSTTTTTMEPTGVCGDFNGNGSLQASDALGVLRAAVGQIVCALCVCDRDGNGSITASDALGVLRMAVGQTVALDCPACS